MPLFIYRNPKILKEVTQVIIKDFATFCEWKAGDFNPIRALNGKICQPIDSKKPEGFNYNGVIAELESREDGWKVQVAAPAGERGYVFYGVDPETPNAPIVAFAPFADDALQVICEAIDAFDEIVSICKNTTDKF